MEINASNNAKQPLLASSQDNLFENQRVAQLIKNQDFEDVLEKDKMIHQQNKTGSIVKEDTSADFHAIGESSFQSIDILTPQKIKKLKGCWKYAKKFDIFNFDPVPRTNKVSTGHSQSGSILAIFLFALFIIWSSWRCLYAPLPFSYSFQSVMPTNTKIECLEFGFGFYEIGDNTLLIQNDQLFTYSLQQYDSSNDTPTPVPFEKCRPIWAPIQIDMFCPSQKMYIQGGFGQTDDLLYPRVEIRKCSEQITPGVTCLDNAAVSQFAKGRFFVFIRNDSQKNYKNKENTKNTNSKVFGENANSKDSSSSSYFKQYFIVPGLYLRGLTTLYKREVTTFPNYFSTFSKSISEEILISNDYLLTSEVSTLYQPNSPRPYFSWRIGFDSAQFNTHVSYSTVPNLISLLGGMWSVIYALFAFIYLSYNAKVFYQKHIQWDRFDRFLEVNIEFEHLPKKTREKETINDSIQQQKSGFASVLDKSSFTNKPELFDQNQDEKQIDGQRQKKQHFEKSVVSSNKMSQNAIISSTKNLIDKCQTEGMGVKEE